MRWFVAISGAFAVWSAEACTPIGDRPVDDGPAADHPPEVPASAPRFPPPDELEIVELGAVGHEACVRTSGGHTLCWGEGRVGAQWIRDDTADWIVRGLGAPSDPKLPDVAEIRSFAVQEDTWAAVTTAGDVYRWHGTYRTDTVLESLGRIETAERVVVGSTGNASKSFVCTLGAGKVHCAGNNDFHQLGFHDTVGRARLEEVPWPP